MAESIHFKWPLRTWKKEEEKKNVRAKLQTDRARLARRHLSIFPSTFQLQQERLDSSRRAGKGHPSDKMEMVESALEMACAGWGSLLHLFCESNRDVNSVTGM